MSQCRNQEEIKRNENENQWFKLWEAGKEVPRGKFILVQSYLWKKEKSQKKQSNLTSKGTVKKKRGKKKYKLRPLQSE